MNLSVASCYHPDQVRSPEDFESLSPDQQGIWYEWAVAQELERRLSLRGEEFFEPLAFWQSKNHEIDFYNKQEGFIEVKRGKSHVLDFTWFPKQFGKDTLKIINRNDFETPHIKGITLENFLSE